MALLRQSGDKFARWPAGVDDGPKLPVASCTFCTDSGVKVERNSLMTP